MSLENDLIKGLMNNLPLLILLGILIIILAIIQHPDEFKQYCDDFIRWYKKRRRRKYAEKQKQEPVEL